MWIFHILFIHSSVDEHLNSIAINVGVQVIMWTHSFISLEYIPSSAIAGSMSYFFSNAGSLWGLEATQTLVQF